MKNSRAGLQGYAPGTFSRRAFLERVLLTGPVLAVPWMTALSQPASTQATTNQTAASQSGPILHGHGRISPPVPVPDVKLIRQDGERTSLLPLVKGRVTAVQIMFTSCTTTCPIQAAIFQRVQGKMPDMGPRKIQLLSLSIDPDTDTPQALAAWLRRFHAGPSWIAAAPAPSDARLVQRFFGTGSDASDHSNQVSILDREGRLVWRTYELPAAEEIVGVLVKV